MHIALQDYGQPEIQEFVSQHSHWKSIKFYKCNLASRDLSSETKFFRTIALEVEEIEFCGLSSNCRPIVDSNLPIASPKLKKLKSNSCVPDFRSSALEVLNIGHFQCGSVDGFNSFLRIIRNNLMITSLIIDYVMLVRLFTHESASLEIGKLKLKVLIVQFFQASGFNYLLGPPHFLDFLKAQSNSLNEMHVDWSADQSLDPLYSIVRAANEICVKTLEIIFENLKIRKLIIIDKKSFLCSSFCSSAIALNLVPNNHITELRLRFDKSSMSDLVFEKLISACPNLTNLYIHEIDQRLLELCSRHVKNLESIMVLIFKVDVLPCAEIKFERLQRVSFFECAIGNHPEIDTLSTSAQKEIVLKMLKKIEQV